MGINKVVYGTETLIDLTADTVTSDVLLSGFTAHNAAGNKITGKYTGGDSDNGGDEINLLHNADWAYSLVNQRSHSGSIGSDEDGDAYCIDRWLGQGSVTPSTGQYVSLTEGTTMMQYMERIPASLVGVQCTFTIQSGVIYSANISFPASLGAAANTVELTNCTVELGFKAGSYTLCGVSCAYVPYIKITMKALVGVKRVFLERGTVSHMEETEPIDYGENLAICQRYCLLLPNTAMYAGASTSTTNIRFSIVTPVTMRVMPSLNKTELALSAISASAGGQKTVTAEINSFGSNTVRMLTTITEGAAVTTNVVQNVQIITGGVILSADL